MRRRPSDITYRCPKCGHTEVQPKAVTAVLHRCRRARKVITLKRVTA